MSKSKFRRGIFLCLFVVSPTLILIMRDEMSPQYFHDIVSLFILEIPSLPPATPEVGGLSTSLDISMRMRVTCHSYLITYQIWTNSLNYKYFGVTQIAHGNRKEIEKFDPNYLGTTKSLLFL